MNPEPAARPRFLRLTQARIGDTLHDGNGPHVTVVNAFTTVNPATEEADDHVTCDRFRTGLADALMKFCRHLFATTNL